MTDGVDESERASQQITLSCAIDDHDWESGEYHTGPKLAQTVRIRGCSACSITESVDHVE